MNFEAQNEHVDLPTDFVLQLTESQPRLFGFLLKRLARRDQALEVLQNVNLTICRKSDEYVPGTNFLAWAFTIAKFQLLSFRQNQSRDKLVFSSDLMLALNSLDEKMQESNPLADRKDALNRCLDKLKTGHKELIMRRYAESMSVKGLAGEYGRTANSVSILLHRIRDQLLNCIEKELVGVQHE